MIPQTLHRVSVHKEQSRVTLEDASVAVSGHLLSLHWVLGLIPRAAKESGVLAVYSSMPRWDPVALTSAVPSRTYGRLGDTVFIGC